ncbi:hypothetical protein WIN67_16640 [Pseudomonas idahonensis]|uniref:hypothetical protein n=1 Tax=Pseudomonas idahonensis TaxID=2942628 RepID=UPI0030CC0374
MDDPSLTQDPVNLTDEPAPVDAVTAELKAEFAKLEYEAKQADCEAVRRAKQALEKLDDLPPNHGNNRGAVTNAIERAKLALDLLGEIEGLISASFFADRSRYWSSVLAYYLSALAKLNSLLARSLRAILRAPLLADGPELSGYKHRLR